MFQTTRILSYKKQLIRNTSGISGNDKKQALVNPKTLRNIALVILNFELQKRYLPQKKAKIMYN